MILRLEDDSLIANLVTPFSLDSPQTLVITQQSFPLSVSTNLLRLASSSLSTLLSSPPCLTTSLIIPDTNLNTLSALLDLLTTGRSSQSVSARSVEDLADLLGMENFSLSPDLSSPTEQDHTSPERGQTNHEIDKIHSYSCVICCTSFNSQLPLGFHYCKHFTAELQRFDVSRIVERQTCVQCDKTFPNQRAVLCHVGVRHGLLNKILRSKGITEIDIPVDKPLDITEKIHENDDHDVSDNMDETDERICGVCSEDFSSASLSSLVLHYCDHFSEHLPSHFAGFYSDNSCNICNEQFAVSTSLMSHIGVRHAKINIVLRAFNIPAIKFPRRNMILRGPGTDSPGEKSVKRAVENEEKGKLFHCHVCGKGDDVIGNLGVHMATIHFHEDLREFISPGNSCSLCDKTFKTKQLVTAHVGLSHGKLDEALLNKGYSSFSCLKTFKKRNKAGRRKGTRNVQRRLKCEICGKEEENTSLLKLHLVLKHYLSDLKLRYKSQYEDGLCMICSRPYSPSAIWQHIGAVHNKLDKILLDNGLTPFSGPPSRPTRGEILVEDDISLEETKHEIDYNMFETPIGEENVEFEILPN